MKKILIFSLAYFPRVGGAEIAIKEITDRIPDIEFHMLTMRFSRADALEEKIGNVLVHRVGLGSNYFSKILFAPLAALAARRLHAQKNFDAAWAMMSYMTLPLMLSGLRLPYVLTLQEGDTENHMFGRMRILPFLPLINRGFRRASVVQAISNYLGGWARARRFAGPLEIIPNGVDVKNFSGPLDFARGKEKNGTTLITTSRLVHKNAVDDILHALALLPKDTRLVVAGDGPDETQLKKLAQELKVAERVEWKGYVSHEQLPALLHAADIFIRPSRSEGMGNSFVEAMAAGLPVIATQEGGLKDFISRETAFVVEKNNPTQIAEQVLYIVRNPEHVRGVVETARELVIQKYNWDLIARDMRERVFARVLDKKIK